MANTRRDFVSDGSTTVYDVAFDLGFISRDHVFVYLDDDNYTEQLDYSWVTDTQIELNVALPTGTEFSIRRVVPRNELVNNYSDGAILRERELDNSFLQSLMIGEEQEDGYSSAYLLWQGDVDAQGHRLQNLPLPIKSNEPTLKVETDEVISRVESLEVTTANNTGRLTAVEDYNTTQDTRLNTHDSDVAILESRADSAESRLDVVEGVSAVNSIKIEELAGLLPTGVETVPMHYATVNTTLGDKYLLGSVFNDADGYDTLLGKVYLGTATTQEITLVNNINSKLGLL